MEENKKFIDDKIEHIESDIEKIQTDVIDLDNIRKNYYSIDTDGKIYVINTGKVRKTTLNSAGYELISLALDKPGKQKYFLLHRLVMRIFDPISNYKKMQVNHKDGDKENNRLINLEWVTPSQNNKHAHKTGLAHTLKGEDSVVTDFTNNFVHLLCRIMEYKYYSKDILEELKKHGYYLVYGEDEYKKLTNLISTIRLKTAWVDISKNYNILANHRDNKYGVFENKTNLKKCCKMILDGFTVREIALEIFNDGSSKYQHHVRSVKTGRTYRWFSKDYW